MDDIEGLNELVLYFDNMGVKNVDEFSKILLLIAHLHVLINTLQDREQERLIDAAGDVIEDVSSLLKVVVAEWTQQ